VFFVFSSHEADFPVSFFFLTDASGWKVRRRGRRTPNRWTVRSSLPAEEMLRSHLPSHLFVGAGVGGAHAHRSSSRLLLFRTLADLCSFLLQANKLSTVKKCLNEVLRFGGPFSARDLYPVRSVSFTRASSRDDFFFADVSLSSFVLSVPSRSSPDRQHAKGKALDRLLTLLASQGR